MWASSVLVLFYLVVNNDHDSFSLVYDVYWCAEATGAYWWMTCSVMGVIFFPLYSSYFYMDGFMRLRLVYHFKASKNM
uniref:Uncharacterized protein n=1 Tax=Cannabis sativa TaxID=3483 RepID=A0A803R3I4_CANSA